MTTGEGPGVGLCPRELTKDRDAELEASEVSDSSSNSSKL